MSEQSKDNDLWEQLKDTSDLTFELDDNLKVQLKEGKFYKWTLRTNGQGESNWIRTHLFSAPLLQINALVKQGDKWKIRYTFENIERLDTREGMVQFISHNIKTDRKTTSYFAQFLLLFRKVFEEAGIYETAYESIAIVENAIEVRDTSPQSIEHIVQRLSELYQISTNPESFITSLCYDVLAPFSYEIRSKGQKFPYRLLSGRTHGGKTSIETFLALDGFKQSLKDRKETMQTVKTIFTFGQQVEKSRFPFIIDDISNDWLTYHSEGLKGATDGVKFMARGNVDKTQTIYDMLSMPVITMNAEPVIPLALRDRIILSKFTNEHSERQDKGEFERIKNSIQPGFMLNIIKEVLEGQSILHILRHTHYNVKTDSEINQSIINYAHSLLTELFRKYDADFPEGPPELIVEEEQGIREEFITYVATELSGKNLDGKRDAKFCLDLKNDMFLISSAGYNSFRKEYNIRDMKSMTDFINEIRDGDISVKTTWNPCLGKTDRCIVVPKDAIRKSSLDVEINKKSLKNSSRIQSNQKLHHHFFSEYINHFL